MSFHTLALSFSSLIIPSPQFFPQLLVEMGTQATAGSTNEFYRSINVDKAKEIRDYLVRGERYNGK